MASSSAAKCLEASLNGIFEQTTNINYINSRIKALFAMCTAQVFGCFQSFHFTVGSVAFTVFTSRGKFSPEDGNQVSEVHLLHSGNVGIFIEKFQRMGWPSA